MLSCVRNKTNLLLVTHGSAQANMKPSTFRCLFQCDLSGLNNVTIGMAVRGTTALQQTPKKKESSVSLPFILCKKKINTWYTKMR